MNNKIIKLSAIVLNGVLIVFEIVGLVLSIKSMGIGMFQYYTQDSNYFALLSCVIYEIFATTSYIKGTKLPKFVSVIRYMATCCLLLTFFVVIFVLIPMAGASSVQFMLFGGAMLFHHFLCPIISTISFLFFEKENEIDKKHFALSMVPTIIYAAIVIFLNVIKVMRGPYPFLFVYEQPVYMSLIWAFLILGIALLFAWLLWIIKGKIQKRKTI